MRTAAHQCERFSSCRHDDGFVSLACLAANAAGVPRVMIRSQLKRTSSIAGSDPRYTQVRAMLVGMLQTARRTPKAALHRSIRHANWGQRRPAVAICTMVH
jgi:hypothetical protein